MTNPEQAAMLMTILSVVAGGVLTVLTALTVEMLRRPKLRLRIKAPVDSTYRAGLPAVCGRYLSLELSNDTLPKGVRWLSRNAALQCRGTITFHNLDGQRLFTSEMPVRFSRSPEPVPMELIVGEARGYLVDPVRLSAESRMDIYPGDATPLDVAVRFDSDDEAYGWSNLNYFSSPQWRHPEWKIPQGRYLVAITVYSSGEKCEALFRLMNQGTSKEFRLDPAMRGDRVA